MKINKLLIATHNPGKLAEISKQLDILNIELVSLVDLNIKEDIEETGNTFEANAKQKADFYYKLSKIPTLADDGGLEIDILNGEPSVKSRRWPGYEASDQELLDILLEKLKDVPLAKRNAKFVDVIHITDGQNNISARGECQGIIGLELACPMEDGLPWSAIFYPEDYNKVFSQLSPEEKSKLSHRGRALEQIINKLSTKGEVNK